MSNVRHIAHTHMKRIRQHAENSQLNDIASFIPFLESKLDIIGWDYSVDWCSGESASTIEETSKAPRHVSHKEFCNQYKGIFQTIDGEFKIQTSKGNIKLLAVDSSFWEVESDIDGIEEAFENEHGKFIS